ncbi:MAG: hypothetical protein LBQ47_03710 [Endomicrobium sp.]|jgi:hypothetical protein|nr:hypothetical protein [Endomicrobium sp.]
MRTNPHVLEINAHAWLRRMQREIKDFKTLADVSEERVRIIRDRGGFDGVWLMGVWQESPASRKIAREDAGINDALKKAEPNYSKEDIIGSQYSIYGYEVNPVLGGKDALLAFKQKLNDYGISLILDFAGNHLSVDHPLTLSDPDIFIRSESEPEDKNLFFKTQNGDWLAHGKDPYFPAWTDTAQINHFSLKARAYLLEQLLKISDLCDGLRCDMTMLMLNKIFRDAWGPYVKERTPDEEFWPEAVRKVKEKRPDFVLGAEVYWGLEWEIQEMGFDYTYDKILYDRLLLSNAQDIQGHLNAEHLYQKRSIRFISNHDEECPVSAFGSEKSKAAAVIAGTITGCRLFTVSQLVGEKLRLPIQYVPNKCCIDEDVYSFYDTFLHIIDHPCFHGGQWVLKTAKPAAENDDTYRNILSWSWTQSSTHKIVVINYSAAPARCVIHLDKFPKEENYSLKEEFTQELIPVSISGIKKNGLALELPPYGYKILTVDF